ncbi:MAG: pectinesterase family protein [Betaproteobacteria bacterium]
MNLRYVPCLLMMAAACMPANAAESAALRVILVGDSTLATRTGYGDALCGLFGPRVTCINLARGGRSSASYRAEGLWDTVMNQLSDRTAGSVPNRSTYVLIQFGHNDQPGKAGRSTDLASEFPANLARYVGDVTGQGAVPVLVTPLTRRIFRGGVLQNDLGPWADATRGVAKAKRAPLLDLNADSAAAVAAMGSAEADTLAEEPPPEIPALAGNTSAESGPATAPGSVPSRFDYTHLGAKGAGFFARMVAQELVRAVPALSAYVQPDESGHGPSGRSRPQLTAVQAAAYGYAEVLKYTGTADREIIDPWDPLADPLSSGAALAPDYVVDTTVTRDAKPAVTPVFATVQSAVSRALADSRASGLTRRQYILVKPGVYRELLYVPASPAPITIYGAGADAAATRIGADLNAGTTGSDYVRRFGGQFVKTDPAINAMYESLKDRPVVGTPGSAIAWIRNDGFQARNITFENAWNRGELVREVPAAVASQHVQTYNQAVALMVEDADKVQFDNVRFLGFQDTLFLTSAASGRTVRSFFGSSYIEGDTDFIFGDATAYFHRSEIKSLGTRKNLSYATAPSTRLRSRFGFVFNECRFTHDYTANALAGNFHLARQWFRGQKCTPYGSVSVPPGYVCLPGKEDAYDAPAGTISREVLETVGKVIILNSTLGAHINKARPWADWNANGTHKYRPAQFGTDDYWTNLIAAGIDPVRQLGYAAITRPAEPFLAEYRNRDE